MTRILSCVNLKGGVGKTALAVNFAAYCGRKGIKTLLVDLDPQTNATFSSMGVENWQEHAAQKGTVANLLGAKKGSSAEDKEVLAADVIYHDIFENVDIIPSHLDLFTVDLDLSGATSRETKLRRALKPVLPNYDLVVCDCPPNLTIPTQNALALSTDYVIPVSLDFLSAIGIGLLINRVKELSEELECDLNQVGIVISRVGRPARHKSETESTIRDQFGGAVFDQKISERTIVSKSAEQNKSIYESADTAAIGEFNSVCSEILSRMGVVDEDA